MPQIQLPIFPAGIPFATWDKYVDAAKLATIEDERFSKELSFNGKEYALFEDEKTFSQEIANPEIKEKQVLSNY